MWAVGWSFYKAQPAPATYTCNSQTKLTALRWVTALTGKCQWPLWENPIRRVYHITAHHLCWSELITGYLKPVRNPYWWSTKVQELSRQAISTFQELNNEISLVQSYTWICRHCMTYIHRDNDLLGVLQWSFYPALVSSIPQHSVHSTDESLA